MIGTLNQTFQVTLSPKYFDKNIMLHLKKTIEDFFLNDESKEYYVLNILNFSIIDQKINDSNSEVKFILNVELDIFRPVVNEILFMEIIVIDKINSFIITKLYDFKVFINCNSFDNFNIGMFLNVEIENLKNRKNSIIGIGKMII